MKAEIVVDIYNMVDGSLNSKLKDIIS